MQSEAGAAAASADHDRRRRREGAAAPGRPVRRRWNFGGSVDEFRHKLPILERHCAAVGRDPATIEKSWFGNVLIEPNEAQLPRAPRQARRRGHGDADGSRTRSSARRSRSSRASASTSPSASRTSSACSAGSNGSAPPSSSPAKSCRRSSDNVGRKTTHHRGAQRCHRGGRDPGAAVEINEISGQVVDAALRCIRTWDPVCWNRHMRPALRTSCSSRGLRRLSTPPSGRVRRHRIDAGYRIDLLVEERVVVELKAVEAIHPIHRAQLLSYLRLTKKRIGLLFNFNVLHLRDGIVRLINDLDILCVPLCSLW